MKIPTGLLTLVATLTLSSGAQASASCDEGCTDSSFTYCAHLRVYDDASQTWTELCSTPVGADGSYTFTNQDRSLQTQLASLADSKIGIFVSGGEAKGLAKRRKLLTQADLNSSNFTVSSSTTVEALTQTKLQEFYTAKQIAISKLTKSVVEEKDYLIHKNLYGYYRGVAIETAQGFISDLSSSYSSFAVSGQTNLFLFLRNQIDEIDSYSGPSSDLKEGLVSDMLDWPYHAIAGGLNPSDIVTLLTTWTEIVARQDPSAIDRFANQFLSAAEHYGKADVISLAVRFRARMNAHLQALSVPNLITLQGLDPSLDVIDPDVRLMLHHLAFGLIRSIDDMTTFFTMMETFQRAVEAGCSSAPHGTNPESCALDPIFRNIIHDLTIHSYGPSSPWDHAYDTLPPLIQDYVRIAFHGKFDEWLNKTIAMYHTRTYKMGAYQNTLFSTYSGSIPSALEADYTLLLPNIQKAFVWSQASSQQGKQIRIYTECSFEISDLVRANYCEEQVLEAELALESGWNHTLTLTHPDYSVDTTNVTDLNSLVDYLSVATQTMPPYQLITGF